MSMSTFTAPTIVPSSSRSGLTWASAVAYEPSGRSMTISSPLYSRFSLNASAIQQRSWVMRVPPVEYSR